MAILVGAELGQDIAGLAPQRDQVVAGIVSAQAADAGLGQGTEIGRAAHGIATG